jgi:methionyl-tRNA formyltransferase
MVGGHKLSIWKTRVVPKGEELPSQDALPGEVLALTGKGLWVQCGKGQLQILEASYTDEPDAKVSDYLTFPGGKAKLLLG